MLASSSTTSTSGLDGAITAWRHAMSEEDPTHALSRAHAPQVRLAGGWELPEPPTEGPPAELVMAFARGGIVVVRGRATTNVAPPPGVVSTVILPSC